MRTGEAVAASRRIGPLSAFDAEGAAVTGETFSSSGDLEVDLGGAGFLAASGSIIEIGSGYYAYEATAAEANKRPWIAVKLDNVCEESIFVEDVLSTVDGLRADEDVLSRRVGPLIAVDENGDPVLDDPFDGAGELEISINAAAWTAATGTIQHEGDGVYYYTAPISEVSSRGWIAVKLSGPCQEVVFRADTVGVDRRGCSTLEAIRDRALTLVEAIIPATLSANRFLRHRAERDGRLEDWAEKNPTACLRRISARLASSDDGPLVSNTTTETIRSVIELRVAYPQTHRYGTDNARDRDDVIEQDWLKINRAVGIYSRGNFTTATDGSYDCTPLGGSKEVERSNGVDYLVVRLTYELQRLTT